MLSVIFPPIITPLLKEGTYVEKYFCGARTRDFATCENSHEPSYTLLFLFLEAKMVIPFFFLLLIVIICFG